MEKDLITIDSIIENDDGSLAISFTIDQELANQIISEWFYDAIRKHVYDVLERKTLQVSNQDGSESSPDDNQEKSS